MCPALPVALRRGWYYIRNVQPQKNCQQRAVCVRQVLGIWTVLSDAQVARAGS